MAGPRVRFDKDFSDADQMGIADLHRRLHSMVRVGTIAEIDAQRGRARVTIGGIKTDWLKWHAQRAGDDQDWNPPSVKEQVTLLCPSGRMENAVVLTGLYSKSDDSPDNDVSHRHYRAVDGSQVFHDTKNKIRQMSLPSGGSKTTFLNQTAHAMVDGEHIMKVGTDVIASIHSDYIHLHHTKSGIKIEKDKITIMTPMLLAPVPMPIDGPDKAPTDNTPSNSIPTSDNTSQKIMPGDS